MKDKAHPANLGAVVSVRGSVVDIRSERYLPPIYSVLRAGDDKRIVIEVLAQRNARCVRGIALTRTQGLARCMAVVDTIGCSEKIPTAIETVKGVTKANVDFWSARGTIIHHSTCNASRWARAVLAAGYAASLARTASNDARWSGRRISSWNNEANP